MHLRSAEGTGINDTDVQKATKVLLLAPRDVDVLGKQLGIFSVVCAAILGLKADLVRKLQDWVTHMTEHETTYWNLQARDSLFATKLACYIDRKIQLHLLECARASSPDMVSPAALSFTELILEARFDSQWIPVSLGKQVKAMMNTTPFTRHDLADSSSEDDNTPSPLK